MLLSRIGSQRLLPFPARRSNADLVILKDLNEAGNVTPVIDRTFPLSEAADAVPYVEDGRAKGKVVITV